MSFPDDLPTDWEWWFDQPRRDSPRLGAVLGPGANRFATLVSLARQLGLDPDVVDKEGFYVLDRMIAPLEDVIKEDPGTWVTDYLAHRGDLVARTAVEDIASLDAIHGAMVQFGWHMTNVGRNPRVRDLLSEMRTALIQKLAQRVYKMLDTWRIRDAWNAGNMPKGLVRVSSRETRV